MEVDINRLILSNKVLYDHIHSHTDIYIPVHSYMFQYISWLSNTFLDWFGEGSHWNIPDTFHCIPIYWYTLLDIPLYSFPLPCKTFNRFPIHYSIFLCIPIQFNTFPYLLCCLLHIPIKGGGCCWKCPLQYWPLSSLTRVPEGLMWRRVLFKHSVTFLCIPIQSYKFQYIPTHSYAFIYVPIYLYTLLNIPLHSSLFRYIPWHSIGWAYIPVYSFAFLHISIHSRTW